MSSSGDTQLDRWGRAPGAMLANRLFQAAYRSWFRVEWAGLEHIPQQGGALLVSNHAGMLPVDGGIIQYGVEQETGRPVYALAHHGFWRFPFLGTFIARSGAVVGHPENAQRLLREEGRLLLVFPEGGKGPVKPPAQRYHLQRFGRGGFVETALRAGVPIVPIAIMGTEDSTPTLATFRIGGNDVPLTWNALFLGPLLGSVAYLPVKLRARVLPPLHFDEPPELPSYPRSLVMERSEEIRQRLQDALQEMLLARESLWQG